MKTSHRVTHLNQQVRLLRKLFLPNFCPKKLIHLTFMHYLKSIDLLVALVEGTFVLGIIFLYIFSHLLSFQLEHL